MIAALLLLIAQGGAAPAANLRGEWINQHRTAIIRIDDCPSGLCGVVIWSAATARRDAARGGTAAAQRHDGHVRLRSGVAGSLARTHLPSGPESNIKGSLSRFEAASWR